MARNVPKSQVGAKLAALSKKHNVAVGEFEYFKTGDLKEQGVAEGIDDEGSTFKNSLHTIIRVATHLEKQMGDDENFPEWESEMVGSVKDQMVKIMDYEISKKEQQGVAAGLTATAPGTTNEGRFVKGPGGVPLDRQGNAIPPNPQAEPKAPNVRRDANGLTRADYNTVWRKIEDVVGQIFPDGDPIDWLGPWLDRQGIKDYHGGEVLNKACRLNGFKDIYDYYDHFKTDDYGYEAPVREEKEKTNSEGDISTITDPELRHAIEKAKTHYGGIKDPITAFRKLTVRGLKHAEETDHRQDEKIKDFEQVINRMKQEIFSLRQRVSSPVSEGEITEDDVVLSADRRKPKSGLLSKPEPTTNPADAVKVDIPLLIRLLEFAREDAKTDMDLHDLAEKLIACGARGRTLTMKDYERLVPEKKPEYNDATDSVEPEVDESLLGGAAAAGIIANDDDEDFQVSFQRQMEEDQTSHKFRMLAFLKSNEPGDVGQRKEFTITARTDREAKILAKQILAARGMEVRELHIIGSEEIA